jgi:hypothetical protein
MRGATRMLLKVHPDNKAARTLYEEALFVQTRADAQSGNLIYHFDFMRTPDKVAVALRCARVCQSAILTCAFTLQ